MTVRSALCRTGYKLQAVPPEVMPRTKIFQSLQFRTTMTVVPRRIEIKSFNNAAHLCNCKQNNCVSRDASLQ